MIKNFVTRLLLSFTVISMLSCNEDSYLVISPPENTTSTLVPLKVGNSWSFRVTSFDTTGSISWSDTLTFFIRIDTIINNVRWYLEGYNGPMVGQLGFRNDATGFHITNFMGNNSWYPYPANNGDSWSYGIVEATDSIITTPLGSLHCYVYKAEWYGMAYRNIYAPGIGRIRDEIVYIPEGSSRPFLMQTHELISVHIDSAAAAHNTANNDVGKNHD